MWSGAEDTFSRVDVGSNVLDLGAGWDTADGQGDNHSRGDEDESRAKLAKHLVG